MEILWLITVLCLALMGFCILLTVKDRKYFSDKGIPYLGNMCYSMIVHNMSFADYTLYWYKEARSKHLKIAGLQELLTPTIIVTDLDLIKNILVRDFEYFVDRRSFNVSDRDFFVKTSLPLVNGDHWRFLRGKISPSLTSAKIRRMFEIFDTSSKQFIAYLKTENSACAQIDLSEVYEKFTADAVASAAFGLDSKAFNQNGPSEFQVMSDQLKLGCKGMGIVKFLFMEIFPLKVSEYLGISFFSPNAQEYFVKILESAISHRRETGATREDFIQIMLEVKDGQMDKTKDELDPKCNKFTFNDKDINGQIALFLIAALDALTSNLIFLAYVLALNPDVQSRLYQEISRSLKATDGEFNFESIHNLQYFEMVMKETHRLYSPTLLINRTCTTNYRIPETDITIKKGEVVFIPVLALHRDAKNFADPERFDPERWTLENRSKIHPYAFLPFGQGPRNCLGQRLAMTQIKLVVAHLVHNFIIEPCQKTPMQLRFSSSINLRPVDGMWITLRKRTETG